MELTIRKLKRSLKMYEKAFKNSALIIKNRKGKTVAGSVGIFDQTERDKKTHVDQIKIFLFCCIKEWKKHRLSSRKKYAGMSACTFKTPAVEGSTKKIAVNNMRDGIIAKILTLKTGNILKNIWFNR